MRLSVFENLGMGGVLESVKGGFNSVKRSVLSRIAAAGIALQALSCGSEGLKEEQSVQAQSDMELYDSLLNKQAEQLKGHVSMVLVPVDEVNAGGVMVQACGVDVRGVKIFDKDKEVAEVNLGEDMWVRDEESGCANSSALIEGMDVRALMGTGRGETLLENGNAYPVCDDKVKEDCTVFMVSER